MTAQADPYVRVYFSILTDQRFENVYDDDAALAAWLRLLIVAEGAYPAPAHLPAHVKPRALAKLVDAGLVELLPRSLYRIHGLQSERERRSNAGRAGAAVRWQGNATAMRPHTERNAGPMLERDEDETRRDETRISAPVTLPVKGMDGSVESVTLTDDPIPVDVRRLQKLAAELTGQPFVSPFAGLMEKAVAEQLPHGFDRVEAAWRKVAAQHKGSGTSKPTLRQLVLGADDILNPVPQADPKAQRSEEAQADFDRRVKRTAAYIASLKGEPA